MRPILRNYGFPEVSFHAFLNPVQAGKGMQILSIIFSINKISNTR